MIVGFCGAAGSGKDSAAKALIEQLGFVKISFAGALKSALNGLFGWKMENWDSLEWKETPNAACYGLTPRVVAQTFGTDWGRNTINRNLWVDIAMRNASEEHYAFGKNHVFTDVRFPNEAAAIRAAGGILIYVTCVDRPSGTNSDQHESERWLPWLWHYADATIEAAFGQLDGLREAAMNVVENYREGLVPPYKPGAEVLSMLNDIEREMHNG